MSIVGCKGGLRDDGEEALADGRTAAVEPAALKAHRGSLSSSPRRSSHTRSRPLSDGLYDEASPLRRRLCQRHWDQHQDRPTDGPRRAHAR